MNGKFECVHKRFPLLSGRGPTCGCAVADPPSAVVKLSCSVEFAGSDFEPSYPVFTWNNRTSVVQQDLPIPSQTTSYLKNSTSRLEIFNNDPTTYTCQLTFSSPEPTQFDYVSTTAPDFTASCDVYSKSLSILQSLSQKRPTSLSVLIPRPDDIGIELNS